MVARGRGRGRAGNLSLAPGEDVNKKKKKLEKKLRQVCIQLAVIDLKVHTLDFSETNSDHQKGEVLRNSDSQAHMKRRKFSTFHVLHLFPHTQSAPC